MPDVDVLREVQLQRPGFDELVVVARQRRRHSVLGASAGVAVVVLTVGMTAAVLSNGHTAQEPVRQPSPSRAESPTATDEWAPERTRSEGSPVEFLAHRFGPAPSGLDAQLYCIAEPVPTGSPCDNYYPYDPDDDQHWAIEVTQGGRSALFDVLGSPLARDFDEDSLLVVDGTDQAARFRLLQADGTAVELRVVADTAPAAPGPDVMLIQDLDTYRSGMVGPDGPHEHPYLVDDRAGTIQLLDVPREIEWWGPNFHEYLWGGNGCSVFWQQPDSSFDRYDADCQNPGAVYTDPGWNWTGFADWLEPGRLALVEWSNSGHPEVVHASLDRGATWERIEIEKRHWADSTQEIDAALTEALQQLG